MDFNPTMAKKGERYVVTHKDGRKFRMELDHVVKKHNAAGDEVADHIIQYVFRLDQIGDKKGQVWNGYFRASYDPYVAQEQFDHLFSDIQKAE